MRLRMIVAIGAVCFGPSVQGMAAVPTDSLPLEGTRWVVQLTPDPVAQQQGEAPFEESLMFENEKVHMATGAKGGFEPSTYTVSPGRQGWVFATEQASPEEGRTIWTAEIIDEDIKGTMVWTKKNGVTVHYTFEGKR